MFDLIRAVTVHPALVHFTLGTIPVIILAYAIAFSRRSDRWTFVGDVTLVVTAVLTLATATFGAVSNWTLEWPGGLGLWRWVHVVGGFLSTLILVAFAWLRLRARRTAPVAGWRALLGSLGLGLVVLVTGWFGGEMLVFHSGMAVKGAAEGALSPPVVRAATPPGDMDEAMHRLRASLAAATTQSKYMVVESPSRERFVIIEQSARDMSDVALWMAGEREDGPEEAPGEAAEPVATRGPAGAQAPFGSAGGADAHGADAHAADRRRGDSPIRLASEGHGAAPSAQHEPAAQREPTGQAEAGAQTGEDDADAPAGAQTEAERRAHFKRMSRGLQQRADALARAAADRRLPDTLRAVGEVGSACAHCHEETRWAEGHGH